MIINYEKKNTNSRRQIKRVIAVKGNRKIINGSIKVMALALANILNCLGILKLCGVVFF